MLGQDKYSTRARYINMRYYYIKDKIQDRTIILDYLLGNQMLANGLTKALLKTKHLEFLKLINLIKIDNSSNPRQDLEEDSNNSNIFGDIQTFLNFCAISEKRLKTKSPQFSRFEHFCLIRLSTKFVPSNKATSPNFLLYYIFSKFMHFGICYLAKGVCRRAVLSMFIYIIKALVPRVSLVARPL